MSIFVNLKILTMNNIAPRLEDLTIVELQKIARDQACIDHLLEKINDKSDLEALYLAPIEGEITDEKWFEHADRCAEKDNHSNYGMRGNPATSNPMHLYGLQISQKSIYPDTLDTVFEKIVEVLKTCHYVVRPTLIRWMKCFVKYDPIKYGLQLLDMKNHDNAYICRVAFHGCEETPMSELVNSSIEKSLKELIESILHGYKAVEDTKIHTQYYLPTKSLKLSKKP